MNDDGSVNELVDEFGLAVVKICDGIRSASDFKHYLEANSDPYWNDATEIGTLPDPVLSLTLMLRAVDQYAMIQPRINPILTKILRPQDALSFDGVTDTTHIAIAIEWLVRLLEYIAVETDRTFFMGPPVGSVHFGPPFQLRSDFNELKIGFPDPTELVKKIEMEKDWIINQLLYPDPQQHPKYDPLKQVALATKIHEGISYEDAAKKFDMSRRTLQRYAEETGQIRKSG